MSLGLVRFACVGLALTALDLPLPLPLESSVGFLSSVPPIMVESSFVLNTGTDY